MKVQETIRAKYTTLSPRQKPIAILCTTLVCLLLLIILFKCYQAIASSKHPLPVQPIMTRQGNTITIPPHSPLRTHMTIKTISTSNKPHVVSFPGIIEADPSRTVNILPPLTGRLVSLKVKLGDVVKPNQILAVISSPDLALAHADNEKALAMLKLSTYALKRSNEVYHAGGISLKMVQLAQNDYAQVLAETNRTKAKLETLGSRRFNLLTIRAPIEGRVTALNYGMGSYINDPLATLLTISNLTTIWVTVNVPENLVGVVEKNQRVTVHLPAYPKQVLHGKISFVNSFLEPDTRRNKTRIAFPNPNGKLQPNMFATVKVAVLQPHLIMIPISSILMNDDTTSVYVETSPWVFKRREVQLGSEDGTDIRVLSGLHAGERIVICGGIFIND